MLDLSGARAARRGPRLFGEPMLLRRTRKDIAELVAVVWLAVELVRLLKR
jgi:hypothetical protein